MSPSCGTPFLAVSWRVELLYLCVVGVRSMTLAEAFEPHAFSWCALPPSFSAPLLVTRGMAFQGSSLLLFPFLIFQNVLSHLKQPMQLAPLHSSHKTTFD